MAEQAPTWWEGAISPVSESLRRSLPADQQHRLAQLSAEELSLEQRKRLAGRIAEELPPELQQELAMKVALELPPDQLEKLIEVALSVADQKTLKRIKKRLDSGDKKAALIAIVGVAIVFVLEAWAELFVQAPLEGAADKTPELLRQVIQRTWEALKETASETLGEHRHPLEPEMIHIPAGEFWMGTNREDLERVGIEWYGWFEEETPRHRVHLPEYWIGKYPVTNAQFAAFEAVEWYGIRKYWTEAGWAWRKRGEREKPAYWDDLTWNLPNHPVVGVSWYEAGAYTRWLAEATGRPCRLPTEAEWEKAARGTDGRIYPWGNEWAEDHANTDETGLGRTTAVGAFPAGVSPYGALDMIGNVWEWTSSLHQPYPYRVDDGRENPSASGRHVLRGGSWGYLWRDARCAFRCSRPVFFGFNIGFRVVFPGSLPSDS
jgi:formylglycine-generating enzyme required for sulfatase activity